MKKYRPPYSCPLSHTAYDSPVPIHHAPRPKKEEEEKKKKQHWRAPLVDSMSLHKLFWLTCGGTLPLIRELRQVSDISASAVASCNQTRPVVPAAVPSCPEWTHAGLLRPSPARGATVLEHVVAVEDDAAAREAVHVWRAALRVAGAGSVGKSNVAEAVAA